MSTSGLGKLLSLGAGSARAIGGAIGGFIHEGLRGVQRVVTVVEPGPLGGRLGRWEYVRQASAEEEVQRAVERFQEDAARLKHTTQ